MNDLHEMFTMASGDGGVKAHMARRALTKRYAWAVPNDDALSTIAALSPIVEIGAGTGYWAMLLRDRGADVICYDAFPVNSGKNGQMLSREPFHPVRRGRATNAARHADRTLMLCWPPYNDNMAMRALMAYSLAGGSRLVYVGEWSGGCTATDAFFAEIEKNWREEASINIPQWFGINDFVWIGAKAKP